MKKILLAISGSIAFYKAYELISLFKKEGFYIKVLLSDGVLKFVNPMSFEALSNEILYKDNESWENNKNHIAFSNDIDLIVFAPATINSINKLAYGIADNLFIQTLIASKAQILIAPAANTNMYEHFSTQKSLKILKEQGAIIVEPIVKKLACNYEGIGALADIDDIFYKSKRAIFKKDFFKNKKVIISGGGTKEKIDKVRCISNFSSGKMAKAIADAFYFLGADVVFLSSIEFKVPYKISIFESSNDLKNLLNHHKNGDFLIMTAAVSDFVPEFYDGKIKKDNYKNGLNLRLNLNEDLLKEIDFKGKKIGFKLEFDKENAILNAKNSLINKNLDLVCLNIFDENIKFGLDENKISFISKDEIINSNLEKKEKLSFMLAEICEKL